MKKKYVLLLFAALIAAVFLGGCKKAETATTASTASAFTGYPMNAQDVTVSWLELGGVVVHSRIASPNDSPFHKDFAELTGINVNWIYPTAGTDVNQFYALMMAESTLPDIIHYDAQYLEAERLIDEGVIYDLTPYMEKYAPNYYKYIKAEPIRDKSQKTDSGKYWRFGFFRGDGPFTDTFVGPMVRKDWLDAQGLPMPVTIDDWDKTIRVFNQKYGAQLTFEKNIAMYGGLCGAFGAYALYTFRYFVDPSGKVQAANIQPEYRNYLAKLNEWWRDGLIDPDHLTSDRTELRSKALDNKFGISFGAQSLFTSFVNDAKAANNGAEWVGLQYPTGKDGTLSMVQGNWGVLDISTTISTSCPPERLEYAMRLLDYAYSEEGNLFWNFGKKGVSWDYDASGNIVWSPLVVNDPDAAGDVNNVVSKWVGIRQSGPGIQTVRLIETTIAPVVFEAVKAWFYPNEEVAYKHVLPPGITISSEDSARAAELQNTINTYASEMAVSFVTGQTPLSQFDAFVARLNQMGLPELLRIQQDAYDRYQAR